MVRSGCSHSAHWRCVVAPTAPCRRPTVGRVAGLTAMSQARPCALSQALAAVSRAWLAVSRACLAIQLHAPSFFLVTIQILYRNQAPAYPPASLSRYTRLYRDTPSQQPACHNTISCIATQLPSLMHAHNGSLVTI